MAAARDIIAERGYPAATFQHIARRAGVSRPTLHYYFATREDLYDTLLGDVRDLVERCAAEALKKEALVCQLAAFANRLHRLGAADPALLKLVMTARIDHHRSAHRHEAAAAVVSTVHAFYDAVVLAAARRGELNPGIDVRAVSDMLGALFWGFGFYAGFIADDTDIDGTSEVARQLLRMLGSGLLNVPSGASVDG